MDVVETGEVRVSMTREQFLEWNPDEGFLYEYDNGFAVQTTGRKKEERYIIRKSRKHSKRLLHMPSGVICTKKTTFG